MKNSTEPGLSPSKMLALSLAFSLSLALFVERRVFWDPLALNDDVRNQVYWLARIINPHIFQSDYIADYFTQPLLISPLLHGLYQLAANWVNPLAVTQFLPFGLVLVATFFLFKFCEAYRNARYAFWVAYSFNASIWIIKNLAGGLPRAFVYPLLFCLLWAIQTRKPVLVAATLCISALIYPPALLLGLIALLVDTIRAKRNPAEFSVKLKSLGLSLIGSLGVALWRLWPNPATSQFGHLTNLALATQMRDFYWGGRIVLFTFPQNFHPTSFPTPLIFPLLNYLPHLYILIPLLVFGLISLIYTRFLKPRLGPFIVPSAINSVLAASAILYALSWLCLFYLYVPERYLEYTFYLMPAFIFGGFIYLLQTTYPKIKIGIAIGFILLSLFGTHFFWRADLVKIPRREILLYNYLKTLQGPVMIATSPSLASNIPAFAFKSVMLSNEAYIPFHQAYFQEMKTRLHDWLNAAYATNSQPVRLLIRKYHISHIVLQGKDFSNGSLKKLPHKTYYAFEPPFYASLKHQTNEYYLLRLPKSCFSYISPDFRVVDVNQCWPDQDSEN